MTAVEIHAELLLGRRVVDAAGRVVGRIEEFDLDTVDGETIVTAFRVGPDGLWERLGGAAIRLPLVRALPLRRRFDKIPWQQLDLSDPHAPRWIDRASP